MKALVWQSNGDQGPGCLAEVTLTGARLTPCSITLPGVTVLDRSVEGLDNKTDLCYDHARGGGWLVSAEEQAQARAFGVVNVAYHLQRGLGRLETLLGHALPPLVAKIGTHTPDAPTWSGAHYRLPADDYSELPEREPIAPTGEIHFAAGHGFISFEGERYFRAPAHNPAIIYHELGHHLCRHTADFRLNRRRPPLSQGNRKIPLDEGTSDYIAAIMLEAPDIFGWQRPDLPLTSPQRRCLSAPWTMAHYRGGSGHDPHIEGTVWSSALWAVRSAIMRHGIPAERFDEIVIKALDRFGGADHDVEWDEALRRRRHFSRMLETMLAVDVELDAHCGDVIERVCAERGIYPGHSNRELRDMARKRAAEQIA